MSPDIIIRAMGKATPMHVAVPFPAALLQYQIKVIHKNIFGFLSYL